MTKLLEQTYLDCLNFYSWTQYDFRLNMCDWRILAVNEKRIVRDCLNRED